MDGWIDGQMEGRLEEWVCEWIDGCNAVILNNIRWTGRLARERTDERTDRWIESDRCTGKSKIQKIPE